MSSLHSIEQKGAEAVKRLRREKLANGLPFMINSTDLPPDQCYLEYPDGSIHLVTLAKSRMDFDLIRMLSEQEEDELRSKFHLEK